MIALSACTTPDDSAHTSQLDGPVDYQTEGGFIIMPPRISVHLELDGSATKQVTIGSSPPMTTHGMIDAASLAALREAIAAVDLEGLRDDYSCGDFPCTSDQGSFTIALAADGATKQIRVYGGIADRDLPPGLVTILADLDRIARQLP